MAFSSSQLSAIEETLQRVAAESILATSGRDDGLVPAYSLLGELADACGGEPEWTERVTKVRAALEARLDAAQPFDELALKSLRELVEWLSNAIHRPKSSVSVAKAIPAAASCGMGDQLLIVDIDQNRDLLAEFHCETLDHLQQIEAALLELDRDYTNIEAINSLFRSFHTIKGNAGFLGLLPMQRVAHEVESLLDLARNGTLTIDGVIVSAFLRARDTLQMLTDQVACTLRTGCGPKEIVPVAELISTLKRRVEGGGSAAATVAPTDAPTRPVMSGAVRTNASTVRVDTEKLDALMNAVGELVIVQSQLVESSRESGAELADLRRTIAHLSRITRELQSNALSLRMVPIKSLFQKMERLARDLSQDFGKELTFVTEGEDTELDRTVVEEIADPLVHMVRNALDHGIELPADRSSAGKSVAGQLRLHAYHRGGNIVLELGDDGRGIDPERVRRKAIEQGIVAPAAVLSPSEVLALIFAPGFSTAEKVTSVSGRGVGMDVVKRNIERLRGRIEISSELGRGTVFKIVLPLTLAIIDGLVVRVGENRFILPSAAVQMAVKPSRESVSTIHGTAEVLELRGRFLPVHRLDRQLGVQAHAQNPWDGIALIVDCAGHTTALLVDEMIDKQEVVIKPLGALMQNRPGVSGGAILGDGNIALILDPNSLLRAA